MDFGLRQTGDGPLNFDLGIYADGLFQSGQERYGVWGNHFAAMQDDLDRLLKLSDITAFCKNANTPACIISRRRLEGVTPVNTTPFVSGDQCLTSA